MEDYEQQVKDANDEQAFWIIESVGVRQVKPENRINFLKREDELIRRCMERHRSRRR